MQLHALRTQLQHRAGFAGFGVLCCCVVFHLCSTHTPMYPLPNKASLWRTPMESKLSSFVFTVFSSCSPAPAAAGEAPPPQPPPTSAAAPCCERSGRALVWRTRRKAGTRLARHARGRPWGELATRRGIFMSLLGFRCRDQPNLNPSLFFVTFRGFIEDCLCVLDLACKT